MHFLLRRDKVGVAGNFLFSQFGVSAEVPDWLQQSFTQSTLGPLSPSSSLLFFAWTDLFMGGTRFFLTEPLLFRAVDILVLTKLCKQAKSNFCAHADAQDMGAAMLAFTVKLPWSGSYFWKCQGDAHYLCMHSDARGTEILSALFVLVANFDTPSPSLTRNNTKTTHFFTKSLWN